MNAKKLTLSSLLILMLGIVGCGDTGSADEGNNADSATDESAQVEAPEGLDANDPNVIAVGVTTMQCEACVKTITQACEALDGVEDVDVRLGDKAAYVKVGTVTPEMKAMISKAIAKAGYTTEMDERDEEGYAKLPDCCKEGGMDDQAEEETADESVKS